MVLVVCAMEDFQLKRLVIFGGQLPTTVIQHAEKFLETGMVYGNA